MAVLSPLHKKKLLAHTNMNNAQSTMVEAALTMGNHKGYLGFEDMKEAGKRAVYTGLASAAVYAFLQYVRRTNNPLADFKDPVDMLHRDPELAQALYQLQSYKHVYPQCYTLILQTCDRILFIEHALLGKQLTPDRTVLISATKMISIVKSRLDTYISVIRKEQGAEHAKAAIHFKQEVLRLIDKHVTNIFILMDRPLPPTEMAARAKSDFDAHDGSSARRKQQKWEDIRERATKARVAREQVKPT
jgi:hypothetical protein